MDRLQRNSGYTQSIMCWYSILRHRRLSLFGYVALLDPGGPGRPGVPAHDALRLMMDT